MNQNILGGHSLAFAGSLQPGQGHVLTDAARITKEAGGEILEIVSTPLNQMSAKETASAVLAGGISQVSLCRFFPGDGSLGDPLGVLPPLQGTELGSFTMAVEVMFADLAFIRELWKAGLSVKHITGPSCFVLGHDYQSSLSDDLIVANAVGFYNHFAGIIDDMGLQLNIEYLRPEEDKALGSLEMVRRICTQLGKNFRWHADTFHMWSRRLNPAMELRASGDLHGEPLLGYLHAHGHDRGIPGQCLNGWVGDNSHGWDHIGAALRDIKYTGPIVAEPFGQVLRNEIPVLGEGLPPAIDPKKYYDQTFACFRSQLV